MASSKPFRPKTVSGEHKRLSQKATSIHLEPSFAFIALDSLITLLTDDVNQSSIIYPCGTRLWTHACFCLGLVCSRSNSNYICPAQLILGHSRRFHFRSAISAGPEFEWTARATTFTQDCRQERWISWNLVALLEVCIFVHSDGPYIMVRSSLRLQLTKSLRNDCGQWWVGRYNVMEKAAVIGSSRNLYQPIRNISPRKPRMSEVIKCSD